MPGLLFNGTTSDVTAGSMPAVGIGTQTWVVMFRPTSLGEGNLARILIITNTGGTADFRMSDGGSGALGLSFFIDRVVTDTQYITSNRFLVAGASEYALVAVTFDDAATPEVHMYSSSDGTNNNVEVAETTYSTATDGSGAVLGAGASTWHVGNNAAGTRTFAGDILYAAMFDRVLTVNELQWLAAGGHPFGIANADARGVYLGVGSTAAAPLEGPGIAWTVSNCTDSDIAAPGGGWFNTAGGAILL